MKNIEKYYDEINRLSNSGSRSVNCVIRCMIHNLDINKPLSEICGFRTCYKCGKEAFQWLNSEYIEKVRLKRHEKEFLESLCTIMNVEIKEFWFYHPLKSKGWFEHVSDDMTIGHILSNCEVIE